MIKKLINRIDFLGKKYLQVNRVSNLSLNLVEKKTRKKWVRSLPPIIDMVITKRCNSKCIMCIPYKSHGEKDMSLGTFTDLAKRLFPTSYEVRFCSGGEPLLNPDLPGMLEICNSYKIIKRLLTNGMLLNKELAAEIIDKSYLSMLGISLDGAEKATVEKIRVGISFHQVLENISYIIEIKRRQAKKEPKLYFNFTLMRRNVEELPGLIDLASKLGMDQVHTQYLAVPEKMEDEESLFYHQGLTENIFNEAKERARRTQLELFLPPLIKEVRNNPSRCIFPWSFIMVDIDGTVMPCYKAWDMLDMGNLLTGQEFFAIWNNEAYQALRSTIDSPKPYFAYCRICSERLGYHRVENHLVRKYWNLRVKQPG